MTRWFAFDQTRRFPRIIGRNSRGCCLTEVIDGQKTPEYLNCPPSDRREYKLKMYNCLNHHFDCHQLRGIRLKGEKRERWMQLCEQAANEQDAEKLMVLIHEIDALLQEKENRLRRQDVNNNK